MARDPISLERCHQMTDARGDITDSGARIRRADSFNRSLVGLQRLPTGPKL
jgi:hypothetical protein